jgi:hypothetical protein
MTYKYSVAISFLTQDEHLALELRDNLKRNLDLPIFLYSDWQHELTGKSIEEALSPIFESLSRIVVVIHRQEWGKTGGTLIEYRAISRRRLRSDERFLYLISVERNSIRTPWSEDLIYHDLKTYPLHEAVTAILRMVNSHEQDLPDTVTTPPLHAARQRQEHSPPLQASLRQKLIGSFVTEGLYKGHFGGSITQQDAKRWQPKGGEIVDSNILPKLPYYYTYWGYEAALRLAPDYMSTWAPVTIEAINQHFGVARWLKVVREYAFSDGPRTSHYFAESIRHIARAAELTYLLAPHHRRVSEVAWNLVREANELQHADGGWPEFRDVQGPSSLWSTAYVYRFLSKLSKSETMPDERKAFLEEIDPLISGSERFLVSHWQRDLWVPNAGVPWDEGAAAILAEVGPFISKEGVLLDVYHALRNTLTPAGRLLAAQIRENELPEDLYVLRLLFGLKSGARRLAQSDSRYLRAVEWLSECLDLSSLTTYDIAFTAAIFNLQGDKTPHP